MSDESFDIEQILVDLSSRLQHLLNLNKLSCDERELNDINELLLSELYNLIEKNTTDATLRIEGLEKEINFLKNEILYLSERMNVKPIPDIVISESETLVEQKKILLQRLEPLKKQQKKILDRLNELKDEETALNKLFERENEYPICSILPSNQEMADFKLYITNLNEELEERRLEVNKLNDEIATLIEEVGINSDLDPNLFDGVNTSLADKNYAKLQETCEILKTRKEEQIEMKTRLMDKLSVLWNRINIDVTERENFLNSYRSCRKSTLNAMEDEIERCNELKKACLSDYIQKLHRELVDLWHTCKVGEEEKSRFSWINSNECSDEIAANYEELVEYYKQFYADNRKIFDLLEERFTLYDQYIKLENAASDPDRLFHNRGGKLLQEEKKRKQISVSLLKLDKELLHLAKEYKVRNETTFLYFGEPLESILSVMSISKKKTVANKENNNMDLVSPGGARLMKPFPRRAVTPVPSENHQMKNYKNTASSSMSSDKKKLLKPFPKKVATTPTPTPTPIENNLNYATVKGVPPQQRMLVDLERAVVSGRKILNEVRTANQIGSNTR